MTCNSTTTVPLTVAYQAFLDELTKAGLLVSLGVQGLYGHSGTFEDVLEGLNRCITLRAASTPRTPLDRMRLPGLLSREHYLKTAQMENFPDLMGSVHSFTGNERDQAAMLAKRDKGEDWTRDLTPSDLMLVPACCYPLYPTATGTLPPEGRTVDLLSAVFRHEPSIDPCRMQVFRQREFVRLGTAEQALEHRSDFLALGKAILNELGLDVEIVIANDPFFGRSGRMMASAQKEQDLKHEIIFPVATTEKPTAISSTNYHLDYFGKAFDIKSSDGETAHTSCIGFGLERITLALFKHHGFATERWPADVKTALGI